MKLLRRVLYWQAALWAATAVALVAVPGWLVERVLDQPPLGEDAWLRITGVTAFALALLMVLVANRLEDVWWWAWAFVILEAGTAAAFVLNALAGLAEGVAAWPWWILGALNALVGAVELAALARTGVEKPVV